MPTIPTVHTFSEHRITTQHATTGTGVHVLVNEEMSTEARAVACHVLTILGGCPPCDEDTNLSSLPTRPNALTTTIPHTLESFATHVETQGATYPDDKVLLVLTEVVHTVHTEMRLPSGGETYAMVRRREYKDYLQYEQAVSKCILQTASGCLRGWRVVFVGIGDRVEALLGCVEAVAAAEFGAVRLRLGDDLARVRAALSTAGVGDAVHTAERAMVMTVDAAVEESMDAEAFVRQYMLAASSAGMCTRTNGMDAIRTHVSTAVLHWLACGVDNVQTSFCVKDVLRAMHVAPWPKKGMNKANTNKVNTPLLIRAFLGRMAECRLIDVDPDANDHYRPSGCVRAVVTQLCTSFGLPCALSAFIHTFAAVSASSTEIVLLADLLPPPEPDVLPPNDLSQRAKRDAACHARKRALDQVRELSDAFMLNSSTGTSDDVDDGEACVICRTRGRYPLTRIAHSTESSKCTALVHERCLAAYICTRAFCPRMKRQRPKMVFCPNCKQPLRGFRKVAKLSPCNRVMTTNGDGSLGFCRQTNGHSGLCTLATDDEEQKIRDNADEIAEANEVMKTTVNGAVALMDASAGEH